MPHSIWNLTHANASHALSRPDPAEFILREPISEYSTLASEISRLHTLAVALSEQYRLLQHFFQPRIGQGNSWNIDAFFEEYLYDAKSIFVDLESRLASLKKEADNAKRAMSEMYVEEAMEQEESFNHTLENLRVACKKYGDYSSRITKLRAKLIRLNTVPHDSGANVADDSTDTQSEEKANSKEPRQNARKKVSNHRALAHDGTLVKKRPFEDIETSNITDPSSSGYYDEKRSRKNSQLGVKQGESSKQGEMGPASDPSIYPQPSSNQNQKMTTGKVPQADTTVAKKARGSRGRARAGKKPYANSNDIKLIEMNEEEIAQIRTDYALIRLPGFASDPQKEVDGTKYSTKRRSVRITTKELEKLKELRGEAENGAEFLEQFGIVDKHARNQLEVELALKVRRAREKLNKGEEGAK